MTHQPTTETSDPNSSRLSSQIGRQWLAGLQAMGESASPGQGQSETVLIPDFTSDDSALDGEHNLLSEILSDVADSNLSYQESQQSGLPAAKLAPTSDLPEKAGDWTEKNEPKDPTRQKPEPRKPEPTTKDENIEILVAAILERFPLDSPAILVFTGTEKNTHVDETCAKVSTKLAQKNIGKILLVDSDIDGHRLTEASGLLGQSGISDAVNKQHPWKTAVFGGDESNLEFLPSGAVRFDKKYARDGLRRLAHEFKREYQFICVAAGDAHGSSAEMWSGSCDGTYLLVSLNSTHETYAKSAVAQLQTSGARLIGCIVTDSE